MRVSILVMAGPEDPVKFRFIQSLTDVFGTLLAEGADVAVGPGLFGPDVDFDAVLHQLADEADRVLFWEPDVDFNLAATRMALGAGVKLLDALDSADLVCAAVPSGAQSIGVFSGAEVYALPNPALGSALIPRLRQTREPVPIAGCGLHWLWLHCGALSRLTARPEKPFVVDGLDITLSRRLIAGGASAVCDPRLSVKTHLNFDQGWSLEPLPAATAAPAQAVQDPTARLQRPSDGEPDGPVVSK